MIRRRMAEVSADTPEARVRELLEEVVDALDLDAEIQVSDDGEVVTGTLVGEDLGLVIGRHGQTIDALQYLVNAIVLRSDLGETKPVVVDAAGYRARREATLTALADRTAERVRSSGDEDKSPRGELWISMAVPYAYMYDQQGDKIRTVQFTGAGLITPTSLFFSRSGKLLVTPGCYEFDPQ